MEALYFRQAFSDYRPAVQRTITPSLSLTRSGISNVRVDCLDSKLRRKAISNIGKEGLRAVIRRALGGFNYFTEGCNVLPIKIIVRLQTITLGSKSKKFWRFADSTILFFPFS